MLDPYFKTTSHSFRMKDRRILLLTLVSAVTLYHISPMMTGLFLKAMQTGVSANIKEEIHRRKARIRNCGPPVFSYTLQQLMDKSDNFPLKFPVTAVKTKFILKSHNLTIDPKAMEIQLLKNWNSSYPVIHEKLIPLTIEFLEHKTKYGSVEEKALYKDLGLEGFFTRLLEKRVAVFTGPEDQYMLLNGKRGCGGWERIGKANEPSPLSLKDCLSYDEIKVSALLVASSPSFFINRGSRRNQGIPDDDHQNLGIVIGAVGCRFEKGNVMEYQEMMVTSGQNKKTSGYGSQETSESSDLKSPGAHFLQIWADFYDVPYLPTFDEIDEPIKASDDSRYKRIRREAYLDLEIYKKRCTLSAETILLEANERGVGEDQNVFLHVVGLGLGVWKVDESQEKIFIDAFCNSISSLNLSKVSDVYFSWFSESVCVGQNGDKIGDVTIHFGKRDPHETLVGVDEGKLLVCVYAWDGNALPGNEFWSGSLTASGDPAEASSSQIAELQNPCINPMMTGSNIRIASTTLGRVVTLEEYVKLQIPGNECVEEVPVTIPSSL